MALVSLDLPAISPHARFWPNDGVLPAPSPRRPPCVFGVWGTLCAFIKNDRRLWWEARTSESSGRKGGPPIRAPTRAATGRPPGGAGRGTRTQRSAPLVRLGPAPRFLTRR